MSKQGKQQTFELGNSVKVVFSDGESFRGVYFGRVLMDEVTQKAKQGHFIIVYDVSTQRPKVLNLDDVTTQTRTTVQSLTASRLPAQVGDVLRQYAKDLAQQQKVLRKPQTEQQRREAQISKHLVLRNLYHAYANSDGTMDLEFEVQGKPVFVCGVEIPDAIDEDHWESESNVNHVIKTKNYRSIESNRQ